MDPSALVDANSAFALVCSPLKRFPIGKFFALLRIDEDPPFKDKVSKWFVRK